MRTPVFAITFLALALTSAQTLACGDNSPQALAQRMQDRFSRLDQNRDSMLSLDEYVAGTQVWEVQSYYARHKEQKAPATPDVATFFALVDKDRSGFASFDEWVAFNPPELFATLDGC